ncbi:MAG: radical SAM protein [Candidatus Diapherotrites archaeon]|nr:radical SAM protein [Candidatus Diapherotrites archaeon]
MRERDHAILTDGFPKGCILCHRGAKLVLFVTGRCTEKCWYCPISLERAGKDVVYANERPVRNDRDIIKEAKEMNALGAGITGGEPLLVVDRVCRYIELLKSTFGKRFHIHLYTYGKLATEENVEKLEQAGLDEIRFHVFEHFEWLEPALKTNMDVGIEIPVIPGDWKRLKRVVDFCAEKDIFLNLNELEFSDSNWKRMKRHGMKHDEYTNAVTGSKKLALKVLRYAEKRGVKAHFCSVFVKHGVQLTRRLKRRANVIKKPWEKVNRYGLIVKGVIDGHKEIAKKEGLYYNRKKKRIETDVETARKIAKKYSVKAWKVLEWPVYEPWDFEKSPIG